MTKLPRVHPSSHTGLLLAAGTGLIALRLWESGKLGRAWTAAVSGSGSPPKRADTSATTGSSMPSDTGQASFGGSAPIGGGAGSQFGLSGVTRSFQQTNPKYTGPDHSLVPDMTQEWNYLLPYGVHEPVKLPPGPGTWVEEAVSTQLGLPGYEVWKNTLNNAVVAFLHLFGLTGHVGSIAHGGQAVGTSGWPTDPSGRFGPPGPGNAHLAVIVNRQGEQYVNQWS